jgi:hypothetical protein
MLLATPAVLAAEYEQPEESMSSVEEEAEETMWVYNLEDGILWKRLWSLTYGYWKTDWMRA